MMFPEFTEDEMADIREAIFTGDAAVFIRGVRYRIETTTIVIERTKIDLVDPSSGTRQCIGEIKLND